MIGLKKTILFLINGFGIEKKDSYSVYDANMLPTLDRMMQNNLYASVESKASDYSSGYQLLSTGTMNTSNYSYLDEQIESNKLIENPNLKKFNDENIGKETKIHFFIHLNSQDDIDALNKFVKYLKIDVNRIIVHIILNQNNLSEYKTITKLIANFTFSSFKATNIGLIFGENCITDAKNEEHLKSIERVLYNSKSGEAWLEYVKKFAILENSNILPINVAPFCVNDDFAIKNEDTFVLFNFNKCLYDNLINGILNPHIVYKTVDASTLKIYSLFPLEGSVSVLNLLNNVKAKEYMAQYLENTNINSLILTDKENLNLINYMVNGFENVANPRVKYMLSSNELLANKEQMQAIMDSKDYDLIIINTRIDNLNTINEVKDTLHNIDTYINNIESIAEGKATLIISSLFGINKELQISNLANDKATINFYGSVPFILINKDYTKENYSIGYGTPINVLATAIKCCNEDAKYPSLLKHKSALFKSFKEKLGGLGIKK